MTTCDAPLALPAVARVELPNATPEALAEALEAAIVERSPVVFALGEASELLPRWTPRYLAHHAPTLHGVYESSTSPRFGPYHDPGRPFGRVFGLKPLHNYTEDSSVPTREFFWGPPQRAGDDGQPYRYYSAEVERDLPPPLLDEMRPLEAALIAHGPSRASVNLWLGRSPVVAPCHYDGYHNAVAQLSGRKRFLLAPPTAWPLVRAFPFLHPSHAQCQLGLDHQDATELTAAGGRSAVLGRGDVLYLPPLWFHETLALAPSYANGDEGKDEGDPHGTGGGGVIGVNGWVDGAEGAAAADLFELRVPADIRIGGEAEPGAARGGGTTMDGASAAAALVLTLSEACLGDATLVAARVWNERYATLAAEGGSLRRPSEQRGAAGGAGAGRIVDCGALVESRRSGAWARHVSGWARDAARVAARFSDETRGVWLANLAERIAAERLGLHRAAGFWEALHSCLVEHADDLKGLGEPSLMMK